MLYLNKFKQSSIWDKDQVKSISFEILEIVNSLWKDMIAEWNFQFNAKELLINEKCHLINVKKKTAFLAVVWQKKIDKFSKQGL